MSSPEQRVGYSLGGWAAGLRNTEHAHLIPGIYEDKQRTVERLHQLGLPHFGLVIASAQDFLSSPERYFDGLKSEEYYVSVEPHDNRMPRIRTFGLDKTQTHGFVRGVLEEQGPGYNKVILMETYDIHYGGNIIVSRGIDNTVEVEMVEGTNADLVSKNATPPYKAWRGFHTGRFLYNVGNNLDDHQTTSLRRLMFSAINAIPRMDEEPIHRNSRFMPGYYEFVLARKVPDGPLTPIFCDYSAQSFFQAPPSPDIYSGFITPQNY